MKLKNTLAVAMFGALSLSLVGCATQPSQSSVLSIANTQQLNVERMMDHLQALQEIANKNGGNRAVGTQGGQASAAYIIAEAKKIGLTAQLQPFENRKKQVGQNVVIEMAGASKDTAIILGAHYDSVTTGPGINDNGSGVAVLLELMRYYAQANNKPKHTLYFTFWDSEEEGIGGSNHFVKNLTAEQLKGIQAYINLDMIGTKDPTIQIADGDKSSIDEMEKLFKANGASEADYQPLIESLAQLPSHPKDQQLEQYQRQFFQSKGITVKDDLTTLTASDTAPFLGKVPVTSFIFFNEQLKGNELEFAPCYHKACDTIDLVDAQSMQLAGEAVMNLIQKINITTP